MKPPRIVHNADTLKNTLHEGWGSLSWVANEELTGTPGLTLGRVTMKPGESNPRHSHPNCDEILYVLQGRLQHETGGDITVLEPGDTLAIPAGIPHQAINIGNETSDVIVAYSSGRREFKLEPPVKRG